MEPKIIDAGAKPSRKMAVVLVDTGGGMGTITAATAGAAFFTGAKSENAYYRENSYGIQGLDGKVLGPLSYAMSGCDTDGMAKAIKAQITEAFDQYAYVFKQSSACGWGGLASVGTPTKPSKDTWYNGSVSCVVAVQEPGHNYGMQHSSSMTCGTTTLTDSLASCTHSEYGVGGKQIAPGQTIDIRMKVIRTRLRRCLIGSPLLDDRCSLSFCCRSCHK